VDVESRGVNRNFEHREARGSIILGAVSIVKEKQDVLLPCHIIANKTETSYPGVGLHYPS
jgi:hypothetical protein